MVSTFHGLNTAYRGLMTQQSALYVTGHNIANANTPGYTRQRVNFETTDAYPAPSRNRPNIPGQLGTGVQAGEIQRIRDHFLDIQYRGQNSKLGYWEARANAFSQIEDIMNELNNEGLANTIDKFWSALQDLSTEPNEEGTRRVVLQQGIAVADTFNYLSEQLQVVQKDYKNEIKVTAGKINSLIKQINSVNQQIKSIEPNGYLPNDLYDERDRLVDELSTYMNIEVEKKPSGGLSKDIADGYFNIYLLDDAGKRINIDTDGDNAGDYDFKLLDGKTDRYVEISFPELPDTSDVNPIEHIHFTNRNKDGSLSTKTTDANGNEVDFATDSSAVAQSSFNLKIEDFNSPGSLKSFVETYGYIDNNGNVKGDLPQILDELDHMAFSFAERFNEINRLGWSLSEINAGSNDYDTSFDFFEFDPVKTDRYDYKGAAYHIRIGSGIMADLSNIAAAGAPIISKYEENNKTGVTFTLNPPGYDHDADPSTDNKSNYLIGSEAIYSGTEELKNGIDYTIDPETLTVTIKDPSKYPEPYTVKYEIYEPVLDLTQMGEGDGSNALELGKVISDAQLHFGGSRTTLRSFYQGVIGEMGVQAYEANRMTTNTGILRDSVENKRASVSNVSLDEEMTNMIQFQHAYNAAARMITLVDETLDRIINNMGLVGR
ncbi:flagellar hook-associated protein FlgK [Calidifontibacillus oryziterrae]|uniref:flagellar hook-associated protein FlgK n=1 Tax=Calidifontibacillus oryziterrae TaxID=1191699 RepID=UPI0002E1655B|nr:flagellar hook-associated protein FlgK [Calidifontibacillus oryziterrae]